MIKGGATKKKTSTKKASKKIDALKGKQKILKEEKKSNNIGYINSDSFFEDGEGIGSVDADNQFKIIIKKYILNNL